MHLVSWTLGVVEGLLASFSLSIASPSSISLLSFSLSSAETGTSHERRLACPHAFVPQCCQNSSRRWNLNSPRRNLYTSLLRPKEPRTLERGLSHLGTGSDSIVLLLQLLKFAIQTEHLILRGDTSLPSPHPRQTPSSLRTIDAQGRSDAKFASAPSSALPA